MQNSVFGEPASLSSTSARACTNTAKAPPSRVDAKAEYECWSETIGWLSERFEDLHLRVLQRNLRILADPMTGEADILAWIEAEPDRSRPVCPFSFHACLVLYDRRCDLDEIRCRIRSLNRRVLQRRRESTL